MQGEALEALSGRPVEYAEHCVPILELFPVSEFPKSRGVAPCFVGNTDKGSDSGQECSSGASKHEHVVFCCRTVGNAPDPLKDVLLRGLQFDFRGRAGVLILTSDLIAVPPWSCRGSIVIPRSL